MGLFLLGFVLGLKHAFEADHVAAVVSLHSRLGGLWWGIGHTLVLLVAGIVVLVLKINIPARLTFGFEIAVGVVLIILGINLIRRHPSHVERTSTLNHSHASFLIGALHGFAGSGGFVVLLVPFARTLWEGVLFISLFGAGSIIGMTAISTAYDIIHSYALGRADRVLNLLTGGVSIVLGIMILLNNLKI